jgi:hypothetical protein
MSCPTMSSLSTTKSTTTSSSSLMTTTTTTTKLTSKTFVNLNLPQFNEDEVLARFKVCSHDIGDKVISLSEDVLLTCDNWNDPKLNVTKLEEAVHNPSKKHLIFYDMWYDEVVHEILAVLRRCRHKCWSTIEFRGCQERHVNDVLQCVLEMDIVQVVAFSLTNDRFDPRRRSENSTFDVISRSVQNHHNERLECIIFHQRPFHFIQHKSLKNLKVKHLHFLDGTMLHPEEIPELAQGLVSNTSLKSFSFLGGVTNISDGNATVSTLVVALTSHPSLQRLSLNLQSSMADGVNGLESMLASQSSTLKCLTLTGGFPLNTFFTPGTFSQGLKAAKVKHLHLRDIFLFDHDVQDLAAGLQSNQSIESLSLSLDADSDIDISNIAVAVQSKHNLKRLSLSGRCSLGKGVHGIAKLLSTPTCELEDLHLSGAFNDEDKRSPDFLKTLIDNLRGNNYLRTLDLSRNGLTDQDVITVYKAVCTCPRLSNLDLGMNEVTSTAIEFFAGHEQSSDLAVIRVSSPKFSFFQINDDLCSSLVTLLTKNPKLGDINFNMGPIAWHHSYNVKNDKMRWHHFSPSYRVYSLHSKNKRVEYLKAKELKSQGCKDLEHAQYLLDYNWAGRSLASQERPLPLSLWPRALERAMLGRTCFWTGRKEASDHLVYRHDVVFSLLRENLCSSLALEDSNEVAVAAKRQGATIVAACVTKKQRIGDGERQD